VTGNRGRVAEARLAGADAVIEKPFDIDELLAAVHRAVHHPAHRQAEVAPIAPPAVHAHVAPRPRAGHHVASWRARRRNA
jgi:DNA-binding response OmpR family regulator